MASRREAIHSFYRSVPGGTTILEKAAAAAAAFPFKGDQITYAVVTRTDLNGYSKWAREHSASDRAAQLDAFFSTTVPAIEAAGGVFFRDEGDCIVALFSDYFARGASYDSIESYCMQVSRREYGPAKLTAKTSVACGSVAIFQKRHEVSTGDWSAEGEPFVRSARLEAALTSTRQVAFYRDDYENCFASTKNVVAPGQTPGWAIEEESIQVPGVGATGGWVEVVRLDYRL